MPSTNFVRGINPVWLYADLTGNLFDDTFYMWVLTNTIPYIPAPVWHDPSGNIPWTDPIQFLANGTLPIDIFFDETMVYRLEFRQHAGLGPPTQADPLIYLVENYIPNGTGIVPSELEGATTENMISNAQFAFVNFQEPVTFINYTGSAPIEIAPNWFLTLTGTGTLTITQVPLSTTTPNPTNAPYALQINSTGGWSAPPILSQRFYQNGQNWQNQYVSTSITGMIQGSGLPITARLIASNGQPLGQWNPFVLTNNFTQYTDNFFVDPYINLNTPPATYIDYQLFLPVVGNVFLTSFQLVIASENQNFNYQQDTINRQFDHLFHYYEPRLAYKPISSFLTGWDFPLNPRQFGSYFPGGSANSSYYATDQTIIFQSQAAGISTSTASNGSLNVNCAISTPTQFALIQYLDGSSVNELLANRLAAYISAQTATSSNVTATVGLYYTTGSALPAMSGGLSIVATLNADGSIATFNQPTGGVWTQIPYIYPGNSQLTMVPSVDYEEYGLSGFVPASNAADGATFFAIVIGFSAILNTQGISFNCIGLVPGDVPTRPAPLTWQQTFTDCEYYFEKSWDNGTAIGTATNIGSRFASQGILLSGGNTVISPNAFDLTYRTVKRFAAHPNFYSPSTGVTAGNVDIRIFQIAAGSYGPTPVTFATYWTSAYYGQKGSCFIPTVNTNGDIGFTTLGSSYINYQYYVDARLGFV